MHKITHLSLTQVQGGYNFRSLIGIHHTFFDLHSVEEYFPAFVNGCYVYDHIIFAWQYKEEQ